jgi:hypothetical protein
LHIDPYKADPGPELDAVIHVRFMKLSVPAGPCPPYSTDEKIAKRALSMLRTGKPSVIVGRTTLDSAEKPMELFFLFRGRDWVGHTPQSQV